MQETCLTFNNMTKNYKKTKEAVEKVLKKYEKARNCDLWLTFKVWADEHPNKMGYVNGEKGCGFNTMLAFEEKPDTITRIRRKFNQNKQYLATDPVILKRREKERKIKNLIKTFND